MRRLPGWILTVALGSTTVLTARAEPAPAAEHIPVGVRRTRPWCRRAPASAR